MKSDIYCYTELKLKYVNIDIIISYLIENWNFNFYVKYLGDIYYKEYTSFILKKLIINKKNSKYINYQERILLGSSRTT